MRCSGGAGVRHTKPLIQRTAKRKLPLLKPCVKPPASLNLDTMSPSCRTCGWAQDTNGTCGAVRGDGTGAAVALRTHLQRGRLQRGGRIPQGARHACGMLGMRMHHRVAGGKWAIQAGRLGFRCVPPLLLTGLCARCWDCAQEWCGGLRCRMARRLQPGAKPRVKRCMHVIMHACMHACLISTPPTCWPRMGGRLGTSWPRKLGLKLSNGRSITCHWPAGGLKSRWYCTPSYPSSPCTQKGYTRAGGSKHAALGPVPYSSSSAFFFGAQTSERQAEELRTRLHARSSFLPQYVPFTYLCIELVGAAVALDHHAHAARRRKRPAAPRL